MPSILIPQLFRSEVGNLNIQRRRALAPTLDVQLPFLRSLLHLDVQFLQQQADGKMPLRETQFIELPERRNDFLGRDSLLSLLVELWGRLSDLPLE